MGVRNRVLIMALAVTTILACAGLPVRAEDQPEIKGKVTKKDSKEPISGVTIDVFRLDIKATYSTTTDDEGKYSVKVPSGGTYAVVASHLKFQPQYQPEVKPKSANLIVDFILTPGTGGRPSYEDVKAALARASLSDEDRKKLEEETTREREMGVKFNEKKAFFDTGIKALQDKKYSVAVTDLSRAVEGLDDADPKFWGELAGKGGLALAEAHYQLGVEHYNKQEKEAAEKELRAGAKAAAIAAKYDSANPIVYSVQGKNLLLLIQKFSDTDSAETAAKAFFKAAELETMDKKARVNYLNQAGDVYRSAYMTDEAIATYRKVLAEDSNNTAAMYGIGLAAISTSMEGAQQKAMYQTAADYLKAFVDKAGNDPKADEVKGLLEMLAKDFKIKPKPIK